MSRYSLWVSLTLFGLLLFGVIFTPQQARGDSTPPQATTSTVAVRNIHYTLDAADPSQVDQVSFALVSALEEMQTVRVRLVSSSTAWYACTVAHTTVSCDIPQGLTVAMVDQVHVSVSNAN